MMRFFLWGAAGALAMSQVSFEKAANAQISLRGLLEGGITEDFPFSSGVLFGNKRAATESKSCQLNVDAQALVDKDIYGNRYANTRDQRLYCDYFEIKGLKSDESRQFAEQYLAARRTSNAASGSGVATVLNKKGRTKEVPFSWQDDGEIETTEVLTVIDGVTVPTNETSSSPSRSFQMITLKEGRRLNVRSGPGRYNNIIGMYKGKNIVLVRAYFNSAPDRTCRSGQWALLQNNGAGNGFVCTYFLGDAPASTTIADVNPFIRPRKAIFTAKTGYTQQRFKTLRRETRVTVIVSGKPLTMIIVSNDSGLRDLTRLPSVRPRLLSSGAAAGQ